jgi:hypothetical protein
MRDGSYSIRKLIENYSFVAEVEIQIEEQNQENDVIFDFVAECFSYSLPDSQIWRLAACYGALYALEHLPSSVKSNKNYLIRFTKINGYIIDTSSIIVAYASCLAVFNSFSVRLDKMPFIDENTKSLCFPK